MELQKVTNFFSDLIQTKLSIIKILILSKWFVNLRKYGSEQNECVILGNGPSLTNDLKIHSVFINERKKFCVNFFALSEEYVRLKPEYYILAAPEFWLPSTTEWFEQQRNLLAQSFITNTKWKMKLFIPFNADKSKLCSTVILNKNIEIVYFNNIPVEGWQNIINPLFKANLGIPRPHNVLIPAIYLAINTGFKRIVLFGADHSWHEEIKVDDSNSVTVNHEHFYDKQDVRLPMYKLDGKKYFLHDIFRKLHYAFKGYFILNNYAGYMSAKIQNASSRSYIDAFEKIRIT
jgi:hypothetical protein